MAPTRRSFLRKASAAALAASPAMRALAQTGKRELSTSERIGLETMAAEPEETFQKWVGGTFRVTLRHSFMGTIVLTQVETAYYPRRNSTANMQLQTGSPIAPEPTNPFEIEAIMLHFKRTAMRLTQDVYTLDHDWLGTFDLLLVPCAPRRGSTTCTAVITRFPGQTPYRVG